VWLPLPDQSGGNLAMGGRESFSRGHKPGPFRDPKNGVWGSLIDGGTVNTSDNTKQKQDWHEVTLAKPASVGRVVFLSGDKSSNGAWFDTSAGKPQVQVQTEKDGPWTTVGELASYPATTATEAKLVKSGAHFTSTLAKPSCGNKPNQSSSCAGLAIYEH